MEALVPSVSSSLLLPTLPNSNHTLLKIAPTKSHLLISRKRCTHLNGNRRISTARIPAINDVSAVTSPAGMELTWQIVVGALAGVTPFVVAGIEFSKRIIAQRRCEVCGGSGLVLRDNKYYFRCPGCGGFLPGNRGNDSFLVRARLFLCQ